MDKCDITSLISPYDRSTGEHTTLDEQSHRCLMIVQIRDTITLLSDADRYQALLSETVVPSCRNAPGNQAVYLCREINGHLAGFILLSLCSSPRALGDFLGPNPGMVTPLPEEKDLLLTFESMARSYQVLQISESQHAAETSPRNAH